MKGYKEKILYLLNDGRHLKINDGYIDRQELTNQIFSLMLDFARDEIVGEDIKLDDVFYKDEEDINYFKQQMREHIEQLRKGKDKDE